MVRALDIIKGAPNDMQLFQTLARLRRGEMNLLLLAALVLLLVLPGAGHAAALPPQSCEAVLLWLQSDPGLAPAGRQRVNASLSLGHRAPVPAQRQVRSRAVHAMDVTPGFVTTRAATLPVRCAVPFPATLAVPAAANPMTSHEVARLSGIRTNRRLH